MQGSQSLLELLSSLHSNLRALTGVLSSLPVKLKLAVVLFETSGWQHELMLVSGGVVSGGGSVVKDQTSSAASGLPTKSLTPALPPLTLAM